METSYLLAGMLIFFLVVTIGMMIISLWIDPPKRNYKIKEYFMDNQAFEEAYLIALQRAEKEQRNREISQLTALNIKYRIKGLEAPVSFKQMRILGRE
jgi:hypothetical protein